MVLTNQTKSIFVDSSITNNGATIHSTASSWRLEVEHPAATVLDEFIDSDGSNRSNDSIAAEFLKNAEN